MQPPLVRAFTFKTLYVWQRVLIVIWPSHVHLEEEVSAQVMTLFTPTKTNENVDTESICVITVWIRRVMQNGRNNHELQMSEGCALAQLIDNLTTFMCRLSRNLGASTSWNPLGLSRPVMGLIFFTNVWNGACKSPAFHLPCSKRGAASHTTSALLLNRLMWISCEFYEHIGRPTLMKPKVRTHMTAIENAVVS
jgi:hypothetical protein